MRAEREDSGALAPLLDRLVDPRDGASGEPPPGILSVEGLIASVKREVAQVLGTRCTLTLAQAEALEARERSVLDYGLPDLRPLGSSPADARRLEQLILQAVEAYEPRLSQLQVRVQLPPPEEGAPVAVLTAQLAQGLIAEPLSIPLRLDRSGRHVEVIDER